MSNIAYGYAPKKADLKKRMNRIEGQVRGISNMIQNDTYCIDILTQLSAVQGALDKVALELLGEHARHCLNNEHIGPGSEVKADELVAAVGRMLKS